MSTIITTSEAAVASFGITSFTTFYFLSVLLLVLWYVYWRISKKHLIELAAKIPGPPGLPLIGNSLDLMGNASQIFKTVIDKSIDYPKIAKMWIGPRLVVFLIDPRDVELVLSSSDHIDKSPEYDYFKPWFGNGLLISTGEKWKAHRKLIAPTFHLNVLKTFIDLFNVNSRETIKKLQQVVGQEFDCHDYMAEATVEMLLETVMGVSKKTSDQSGFHYAKAVMDMSNIIHLRHTKFWLRPGFLFNITKYAKDQKRLLNTIHTLTRKVVARKKSDFAKGIRGSTAEVPPEFQTKTSPTTETSPPSEDLSYRLKDDLDVDDDVGEKKRMAFLDLLVEASESGVVINSEEIKQQVDTIMFEGHDTTAAGSSFFLSLMGIHQSIQERVYQELHEIFGDSDRPATFADTLQMKYLERCLLEALRLFPPVPVIARQLNQDLKMVSGDYTVPAGCTVAIATFKVHRLEEFYPNPDKFDPDNFLPEKMSNRHYYSFIPFSAGPRSCVGRKYAMLKLKVLLSTIIRNFRILSNLKEEDFQLQGDLILKRAEGFQIKIEPRKIKQ